jgi:tRNA(Ile)-lysidine synthase
VSTSIRHAVRRAFGQRDRVVLAVSGGVDSMVLLDAAAHAVARGRIVVATFDHGTGDAASLACEHVVTWCAAARIECFAERSGETLVTEEELRAARWSFLRDVASRTGAAIATAHTADDQTETVLMRILRGAGARGIAGLAAASSIRRPLLEVSRREILAYAGRHDVRWVEDPSNASRSFLRNRVRHDLLPALERVRPGLGEELRRLGERAAALRADVDVLLRGELGVRITHGGLDVPVGSFEDLSDDGLALIWPAAAALLKATLDRRAISRLVRFSQGARVGSRVQLAGGWEVVRARRALELRASGQESPREGVLSPGERTRWGQWSIAPVSSAGADAWSAWLPSHGVLTIRSWGAGDVLVRSGPGRQRKVKHLLSKAGVTGHERAGWPVVLWEGSVVWVPGVSRSDAATDRSGRPVLAFACEYNR